VGKNISGKDIMNSYDAVCLAIGAMQPRDLPVPGRELAGVHFAMDYLTQQNRVNSGSVIPVNERITAKDKDVLIIGGGDTGSDCVGTAIRQGAKSVTQIEILPKPPKERSDDNPWPYFAKTLKTTTSHEEGCERRWSLSTVRFEGKDGQVSHTLVQEVDWSENGTPVKKMSVVPGKEELLKTDLVLLAMGFVHPIHEGLVNELNLEKNERSNIKITGSYQTNIEKVFSAGDAVTGASLVVRAIKSGRVAAQKIHDYLGVKVPDAKLVK
jgi:glutamate synthase (NADPH) small chain